MVASNLESPLSWVVNDLLGMNNISASDEHSETKGNQNPSSKEI
jgi:hypothetical protein